LTVKFPVSSRYWFNLFLCLFDLLLDFSGWKLVFAVLAATSFQLDVLSAHRALLLVLVRVELLSA
jgi:hypothetical protein